MSQKTVYVKVHRLVNSPEAHGDVWLNVVPGNTPSRIKFQGQTELVSERNEFFIYKYDKQVGTKIEIDLKYNRLLKGTNRLAFMVLPLECFLKTSQSQVGTLWLPLTR